MSVPMTDIALPYCRIWTVTDGDDAIQFIITLYTLLI